MKNTQGEVKSDKTAISDIVENFYKGFYSSVNPKPDIVQGVEKLTNIGSEEILDITEDEIILALSQMKKDRAPGGDGITREMIELGGAATIRSIEVLLNKCLQSSTIPDNWLNW